MSSPDQPQGPFPDPAGPEHLTIAISTLARRLPQLVLPPATPGCRVLILVQDGADRPQAPQLPAAARRPDVTLVALPGLGVAASRNAAIATTRTEFLLFADDDIALNMPGVQALCASLAADHGLAMVSGRIAGPGRRAPQAGAMRRINTAHIGTPELMIRTAPFRRAGVQFDAAFGLGARYPLGDEFVFIADALQRGLRGRILPITLGLHPAVSTGSQWGEARLRTARAAVLRRVFGRAVLPFALAFALRHRSRLGGLRAAMAFVGQCLRPD